MGLKDWLFGSASSEPINLSFGRYTDLYKDASKYKKWDDALLFYEEEDHFNLYVSILQYLTDESEKNLTYSITDKTISFQFLQGSKIIKGWTDDKFFNAEVTLASCDVPNLAVFRQLLEENYRFKYIKFCLNKGLLMVVFQTSHLDANPYKLYYGLKELATISDHKDDYLTKIYAEFSPIDLGEVFLNDSHIVTVKYEYLQQEVERLLLQIKNNSLTSREHVGSLAYLICAFAYKVDYLLVPESLLMYQIEKLISLTNIEDSDSLFENIGEVLRILKTIKSYPKEELGKELYSSKHTFGLVTPVDHTHILNLINSNMEQLKWFVSKKEGDFANAVSTFILGKLMYEYAVPKFEKDLIHLFFLVTESTFFAACGYDSFVKKGNINKSAVINHIRIIEEERKKDFSEFQIDDKKLLWDKATFGPSFLNMMLHINYQK